MRPIENGFYWFTWGSQAPKYDEESVVWMPAIVRDGHYLPIGTVDSDGEIVPVANTMRTMSSINGTEHWQWGDRIER